MSDPQGNTLSQYLEKKGGKIAAEWALRILTPIMDTVQQAHVGKLLHGPVNPDTIFLTNQGQVKLVVPDQPDAQLKPGYAAPETYQSSGPQAASADVYSIAATLYRAITGWAPPNGPDRLQGKIFLTPSDLGATLPPHLEAALMKALAIRPSDRFQSIAELQMALSGIAPAVAPETVPAAVDPTAETKPMAASYGPPGNDIHTVETKPIIVPPLPVVNTPWPSASPTHGKRTLPLWLIVSLCALVGLVGFVLFKNEAGPPAPVIQSFTAERSQIQPGEESILSWSVRGDADVTIDPGGKPVPLFGQIAVAPTQTTTYTLRARNTTTIAVQELTIQVVGRRRSRATRY